MFHRLWVTALALGAAMVGGSGGFDPSARSSEIVEHVRASFYDAERGRAWAARNARYADGAANEAEFGDRTRKALAELKASHTAYYSPDQVEYHALRAIFAREETDRVSIESIGVDFDSEGFARRVFAGGPGASAGIRRGDKIERVDGEPLAPIRSFAGKAGKPVRLTVRRKADAPSFELSVVPRAVNPKAEWLRDQELASRIIEHGGKRIAYVPLFSGAGLEHSDLLRDLLTGRFARADALVLDLRDGWGGLSPDTVTLFSPGVPPLGPEKEARPDEESPSRYGLVWKKPVVILVNGGSRSGKEAVTRTLQRRKVARIVGEKTPGAVLAGRLIRLKGGGVLYLAAMDVFVDGEHLEGVGITPDVTVPDRLPFADGSDPQLDRAVAEAAR